MAGQSQTAHVVGSQDDGMASRSSVLSHQMLTLSNMLTIYQQETQRLKDEFTAYKERTDARLTEQSKQIELNAAFTRQLVLELQQRNSLADTSNDKNLQSDQQLGIRQARSRKNTNHDEPVAPLKTKRGKDGAKPEVSSAAPPRPRKIVLVDSTGISLPPVKNSHDIKGLSPMMKESSMSSDTIVALDDAGDDYEVGRAAVPRYTDDGDGEEPNGPDRGEIVSPMDKVAAIRRALLEGKKKLADRRRTLADSVSRSNSAPPNPRVFDSPMQDHAVRDTRHLTMSAPRVLESTRVPQHRHRKPIDMEVNSLGIADRLHLESLPPELASLDPQALASLCWEVPVSQTTWPHDAL